MRPRPIVLALVVSVFSLFGCSTEREPYVKVIAPSGGPLTVVGCPDCGAGIEVEPLRGLTWEEGRPLPRNYELRFGGKQSTCPALTADQGPGDEEHPAALYTVEGGQCVALPIK